MRRRSLFVVAMVVGLAMITAPVASAGAPPARPLHGTMDYSGTMDAALGCSGPVDIRYEISAAYTDVFLKDGRVREVAHVAQQDTLSGNEKTLVGNPYVWHYVQVVTDYTFTDILSWVATGKMMSFTLPDGTLLISAGRFDLMAPPPWWSPEKGRPADLAALCAYFYP